VKNVIDSTRHRIASTVSTRSGVNLSLFFSKMQTERVTKFISSPLEIHYEYPSTIAGVLLGTQFYLANC
jgi:hypothetical protein